MEDPDFYRLSDPVPAEPFLPATTLPWWIWTLATIAALALVALLLRRLTRRPTPPVNNLFAARQAATAALTAINPAAPPCEVATAISLVLRRFLADTLGDPSLFETHEEFLARNSSLDGLPEAQQATTRNHFATLARLKYGPNTNSDTHSLLNNSLTLLELLTPNPDQQSQTPNPKSQIPNLKSQISNSK